MSLYDETPLLKKKEDSLEDWQQDTIMTPAELDRADQLSFDFGEPTKELETFITAEPARIIEQIQSDMFINGIKSGLTKPESAAEVGIPLRSLMGSPVVRKDLTRLLDDYTIAAEHRKAAVRATTNKILLEGNFKEQLDAAKIIAADPEVGLSGPSTLVQVNNNNIIPEPIRALADSVDAIVVEGLD